MFLILTLVLMVMAIRGVALLIKGEVTGKGYVIRGTVARLIGLCWVSSIILYFVLIALETAVLGASSDAGETTARLLISAIIAIVIGLASAELLKRSSAFDSLVQTLGDASHSGSDRVSAATELGEMGDVRAVEPLIAALENKSETEWVVYTRAAKALAKIGDPRAVEPLIAALKYDHAAYCAAEALGEMGDTRAIEPLVEALGGSGATLRGATLSESEANLRQSAAEALAKFGDARAVEPLIDALGGRYEVGQRRAATVLGKIGFAAVEPLIAALETEPAIPPTTIAELRQLGGSPPADHDDERAHQIVLRAARELVDIYTAKRKGTLDSVKAVATAAPVSSPAEVTAGWHPDPTGRHELRYWSGTAWTEHVSDKGVQATDRL